MGRKRKVSKQQQEKRPRRRTVQPLSFYSNTESISRFQEGNSNPLGINKSCSNNALHKTQTENGIVEKDDPRSPNIQLNSFDDAPYQQAHNQEEEVQPIRSGNCHTEQWERENQNLDECTSSDFNLNVENSKPSSKSFGVTNSLHVLGNAQPVERAVSGNQRMKSICIEDGSEHNTGNDREEDDDNDSSSTMQINNTVDQDNEANNIESIIEQESGFSIVDEDTELIPTFETEVETFNSGEERNSSGYLKILQTRMDYICSRSTFISAIMLTGTQKCTESFYQLVRVITKAYTEDISLMSSKTVRRTLWPYLKKYCIPKSSIIDLRFPSKKVDESYTFNPSKCVRFVKPSEWAKIDVSTTECYNQLVNTPSPESGPDIFKSRIFTHRTEMSNLSRILFCTSDHMTVIARPTDKVLFDIKVQCIPEIISPWFQSIKSSDGSKNEQKLFAKLGPIWVTRSGAPSSSKSVEILNTQIVGCYTEYDKKFLDVVNSGKVFAKSVDYNSIKNLDELELFLENNSNCNLNKTDQILSEGDYCILLNRPQPESNPENLYDIIYCIFVARHLISPNHRRPRQEIMWLKIDKHNDVYILFSIPVHKVPEIESQSTLSRQLDTKNKDICRSGYLSDGRRYVRYPFAMYNDDFQPTSTFYPIGSIGGTYMLPLSFGSRTKSCPTSARIISLTPCGESTCQILKIAIHDIIEGSTRGIAGYDPSGNSIVIFLDMVCLIADYPAASPSIDTKSHSANAPCTACTFQRRKGDCESSYGHSTIIHYRNPCSFRSSERTRAIRESKMTKEEEVQLGLRHFEENDWLETPLFKFQEELQKKGNNTITDSNGHNMINSSFDPYTATIEAPDHCIMGLIKNTVEAYFHALKNEQNIKQIDAIICTALGENGLPRQTSIYSTSGKKLHSMSMKSLFAVFLILEPISDIYLGNGEANKLLLNIISAFQILIRNLYWWPVPSIDGPIANNFTGIQGLEKLNRNSEMVVNKLISDNNKLFHMDNKLGSFMDKPNLHRLLEICQHSIYVYGHVRNIAEMGLETVHQILKKALNGNTHPSKHLTAIHHSLCADWQRRVLETFNDLNSNIGTSNQNLILKNLAILMFGDEANKLDVSDADDVEFLNNFHSRIDSIFQDPLKSYLLDQVHFQLPKEYNRKIWLPVDLLRNHDDSPSPFTNDSISLLQQKYSISRSEIKLYRSCEFVRSSNERNKGRIYPSQKITYGKCIQVCADKLQLRSRLCFTIFEQNSAVTRNVIAFLMVHFFCYIESIKKTFVIAQKMKHVDDENLRTYTLGDNTFQIVEMSNCIRRVGMIHICKKCEYNRKVNRIVHDGDLLSGSKYILLPRISGYPPRMA